MVYAVKALIEMAETLDLVGCKTMYGGKHISRGDRIFLFATERAPRSGLVGRGVVTAAQGLAIIPDLDRQTPRVSLSIGDIVRPRRRLMRADLIGFTAYDDGHPQSELNFKFYRQATDKIVGISDAAATFLDDFF